ncbi:methanogen output domain 1-containing protein [Paracoccus salsus]|uniref:methanogen output domain 1-containing protein n=1 Tax=Paracoccus salsus TaxID=2911061 RepID=UPI001F200952|nr:methanogen output domain 1-containing protein [Paracoccus salsus]MCF3973007.1 methanogen output domain 1-containing protein [Paracoccus salsus]
MSDADVALDRDLFFRRLLRDLSGTLEGVVGLEAAEGYISTVGGQVGLWIDASYREVLGKTQLRPEEVASVCVDLKKRIGGDFYLISIDEDKMVFGNRRCPFGEMVVGRTSLCMMTSNVFGRISADNLGYARVQLDETIARGDPGCRVVVHLKPHDDAAPDAREYYRLPRHPADETS